jgi:hypothetical protein
MTSRSVSNIHPLVEHESVQHGSADGDSTRAMTSSTSFVADFVPADVGVGSAAAPYYRTPVIQCVHVFYLLDQDLHIKLTRGSFNPPHLNA